jgi:serine protein kinase
VREALINMVKDQDIADDTRKLYLEFLQDTLHKALYVELTSSRNYRQTRRPI